MPVRPSVQLNQTEIDKIKSTRGDRPSLFYPAPIDDTRIITSLHDLLVFEEMEHLKGTSSAPVKVECYKRLLSKK